MFDPLATPFASDDHSSPWPSASHPPVSPDPYIPTPSPVPVAPEKGPSAGLYGKEPQIYGQPEPGLISPTMGSNGKKYEKPGQYLRVRITGLDRNRRDILVKLDAQVGSLWICMVSRSKTNRRRICPTSQARPTETSLGLTSSFSSFTSRLSTQILRQLYPRYLLRKHRLQQMKKMTVLSKSCFNVG
jgi:hypothetical protein